MQFDFSLIGLIGSFVGLIVCSAAFWGWGIAARRAIGFYTESSFHDIALGVSLSVFLLSVLAFFNAVSIVSLGAVAAVGVVLFLLLGRTSLKDLRLGWAEGVILAVSGATLLPKLYWWTYNLHDDFHAYLNLPVIALQSGGLESLGFLERGLYGLGGQSLLQALYLIFAPINRINLFDPFLFHLLALLSFHANTVSKLVPNLWLRLLIVGAIAAIQPYVVNVAPYGTVSFLFLSLIYLLTERTDPRLQERKIVAVMVLLIGALASLKLTTVVFTVPLCAVTLVWLVQRKDVTLTRGLRYGLSATALTFLSLLPGMLISYRNFKTPFFPLFGKGNHAMATGQYPTTFWDYVNPTVIEVIAWHLRRPEIKIYLLLLVLWGLSFRFPAQLGAVRTKIAESRLTVLLVAFPISYALLTWQTMFESLRYSYPVLLIVLGLGITVLLSAVYESNWKRSARWSVMALMVVGLFTQSKMYRTHIVSVYERFQDSRINSSHRAIAESYRQAQLQIPEGARVLAFTSYPVFFDFGRNPIFLIDWGGSVSLGGDMPVFGEDEVFLEYLKRHRIDYVLYSHSDQANFGTSFVEYLSHPYLQIREYARYNGALRERLERALKLERGLYRNPELVLIPTFDQAR